MLTTTQNALSPSCNGAEELDSLADFGHPSLAKEPLEGRHHAYSYVPGFEGSFADQISWTDDMHGQDAVGHFEDLREMGDGQPKGRNE